MQEKDLQRAVTDLCDLMGILWWHDNDSRRNNSGLPDLILVGESVLWVELKSAKGRLRDGQKAWIEALEAAGQAVAVWRPDDLRSGEITSRLRSLGSAPPGTARPRSARPAGRRPRGHGRPGRPSRPPTSRR